MTPFPLLFALVLSLSCAPAFAQPPAKPAPARAAKPEKKLEAPPAETPKDGAPPTGTKPEAQSSGAREPAKLSRAEAIKRAEAFLNASPVLVADFVQLNADGQRAEGKLYVHKTGRMRFEYAEPATLEIVADGANVAIRDRKLKTQDLYLISQTPLKFLLNEKIDLEKDVSVTDVASDDSGTAITIEDGSTLGGTSKIKLLFDKTNFALKQWHVTDPQGFETLVSLFNIDRSHAPDPSLFKIDQPRMSLFPK